MNSTLLLSGWGRRLGKKLLTERRLQPLPPKESINKWNIVRGDIVKVTQGPCAGQQGKVLAVLRKNLRIIIEGVNMRRRIRKPKMEMNTPGKIVLTPCSVHYSNVALVDPTTGEATKVTRKYTEDGTKVRVARNSGQIIPKPDPLADRKPRSTVKGPKDTDAKDVFEVTFPDYEKYSKFIYGKLRPEGPKAKARVTI